MENEGKGGLQGKTTQLAVINDLRKSAHHLFKESYEGIKCIWQSAYCQKQGGVEAADICGYLHYK